MAEVIYVETNYDLLTVQVNSCKKYCCNDCESTTQLTLCYDHNILFSKNFFFFCFMSAMQWDV